MILALLAIAGLGYWMWRRGELAWVKTNDLLTAATGIAAIWELAKGEIVPALLLLGVAAYWFATRSRSIRFARPRPWRSSAPLMKLDEAHRVLELPADADVDMIKAAHRRLVILVHPDHGGSADLTARVNAARDTLLAELDPAPRRRRR